MASIFKRNNTGNYLVAWFDHTGRRREKSSRTTDKRAAERLAAKLDADAMLRREGVVDPALDDVTRQSQRPVAEHVADYRA